MFKFSKRSLKNLNTVDSKLQLLANEVLKITPYDFAITEGLRTLERQQKLFKQNTSNKIITKCDGIKNKSKHQLGKAIDIMVYDEHGAGTWEEKYYKEVALIFKQKAKELNINISWGGDWKSFKDYPHFELV